MTYRVQNPATDEVIETFPTATGEEIENILNSAEDATRDWGEHEITERAGNRCESSRAFRCKKARPR